MRGATTALLGPAAVSSRSLRGLLCHPPRGRLPRLQTQLAHLGPHGRFRIRRNIAISLTLSPASIAAFKSRVVISDHGLPSDSASFKGVAFGSYDADVAGSKWSVVILRRGTRAS